MAEQMVPSTTMANPATPLTIPHPKAQDKHSVQGTPPCAASGRELVAVRGGSRRVTPRPVLPYRPDSSYRIARVVRHLPWKSRRSDDCDPDDLPQLRHPDGFPNPFGGFY